MEGIKEYTADQIRVANAYIRVNEWEDRGINPHEVLEMFDSLKGVSVAIHDKIINEFYDKINNGATSSA